MDEIIAAIRRRKAEIERETAAMSARARRLSEEKSRAHDRVLRLRNEIAQLEEVARSIIRMADEHIR